MSDAETIGLDLPASYKYLNALGACVQAVLEQVEGLPEPEITTYNIQLAVHEICTNIVGHAYQGMMGGRIAIAMSVTPDPLRLIVELRDTGRAFDPSSAAEPDLENAQIHGYGLFLVQSLMDDVSYEALPNGNRWRLIKNL
jgi:serine/threonine-protein kinase RsbW